MWMRWMCCAFWLVACGPRDIRNAEPAPRRIFEDDYPAARREALAQKKPIFVDAWASWCHSCMSLRAFVLADPKLARVREGFVWLSVDIERPQNELFLQRFPAKSLPTLWIVDPETEKPLLHWIGGALPEELLRVLSSVEQSGSAFVRAGLLVSEEKWTEAIEALRPLLVERDPLFGQAVESYLYALSQGGDPAVCRAEAVAWIPKTRGTPRMNALQSALSCAKEKGEDATRLSELATKALEDAADAVLGDDRSSLFSELVSLYKRLGEGERARALSLRWAAFLEGEVAKAEGMDQKHVYDAHRLSAYLELGPDAVREKAIPMLLEARAAWPKDYSVPARLARAHLLLGETARARELVGEATALAYGPRAIDFWLLAADIGERERDATEVRRCLREALVLARTQKAHSRYAKMAKRVMARWEKTFPGETP